MLCLLRVAKMLRVPTQPSFFFFFLLGWGNQLIMFHALDQFQEAMFLKIQMLVVFSCNPSAGEVKTRRFLVPITS